MPAKPFVKGDPRINRKGRPKSFDKLRALVIALLAEPSEEDENKTRIMAMLEKMSVSDNPADRTLLLKYGWGNVPDEIDVKHSGKVKLIWPEDDKN
jgi:hypothetical protein